MQSAGRGERSPFSPHGDSRCGEKARQHRPKQEPQVILSIVQELQKEGSVNSPFAERTGLVMLQNTGGWID
ncbi:hypothetical protein HCG48_22590 [Oxynema aestuarii AP17]|uniref:Uncharacterized protein n=1 Tax=Oxynema aestuarii AP17 TaxID=2064643 RepID=A0A6H1U2I1_9CYAN|nr:hypothetical protein HCG48_22590 [Oxynema aestuarii AP17]RMH71492.1 MAG: hypothetical protein D6680_21435 [Cyanobacteria bacterium J007]